MLAAVSRIPDNELKSPIYVVCTADEEVGFHGAKVVVESSTYYREIVKHQSHCVIGEPTELDVVYAHKGIVGFRVTSQGKAAHSSTRAGLNANIAMIPFLAEMKAIHDETLIDPDWLDNEFDPPWNCFNIGINDHNRAVNITSPQSVCTVYFRPMPGQDVDGVINRAQKKAEECGLSFALECRGEPLRVDPTSDFVRSTLEIAGRDTAHTVSYGTDGVCFDELENILVLGPGSINQAHRDDEWISLDQLSKGTVIYEKLIRRWAC